MLILSHADIVFCPTLSKTAIMVADCWVKNINFLLTNLRLDEDGPVHTYN